MLNIIIDIIVTIISWIVRLIVLYNLSFSFMAMLLLNFVAKIAIKSINRRFFFGGSLLSYYVYLKQGLFYPLFHLCYKHKPVER